jgi:hypothetical protein
MSGLISIPTEKLKSLDTRNTYEKQEILIRTNRLLSFTGQGPHRKRRFHQFFVVAGTYLPSRCLVTDRQTILQYDTNNIENDVSDISSVVARIRCNWNMSTESLPNNKKRIHIQTHRLMGGIYEVRRWDGLRCHFIHTRFHKDWFRYSIADRGETQTHRHRQDGDSVNLYLFLQNNESRLKRGGTYLAFLSEIIRF